MVITQQAVYALDVVLGVDSAENVAPQLGERERIAVKQGFGCKHQEIKEFL